MSKLSVSIFFALALVFSGCTVHHYHHGAPHGGKKMKKMIKMKKHHGAGHDCAACGGLPAGHPPVDGMKGHGMKGHGMKGHSMKGHGMKGHSKKGHHGKKGHGSMPKGHGMKSHGPMPKGHPPVGHPPAGHHAGGKGNVTENPFHKGDGADKHKGEHAHNDHKANLPPAIVAFHDSFAAAWHKDSDETRKAAACGQVGEWKKLALAVKKVSGGPVLAAATKELQKQTLGVATSCTRKNGDVQAALKATHDSLHMLFRVASL
jgi:hypothetical protein